MQGETAPFLMPSKGWCLVITSISIYPMLMLMLMLPLEAS